MVIMIMVVMVMVVMMVIMVMIVEMMIVHGNSPNKLFYNIFRIHKQVCHLNGHG